MQVKAFATALLVAVLPTASTGQECAWGSPQAPVLIKVFSDFQCSACGQFYLRTVRPLQLDYAAKGRICIQYEEFPSSYHKHARRAAQYSIAATRLSPETGRLVIDALYARQDEWVENGNIEGILKGILKNKPFDQLAALAADPSVDQEIVQDRRAGISEGVHGTPAIFLIAKGRTRRIPSTVQYEILKRYIEYLIEP